jgi:hypothetical protein
MDAVHVGLDVACRAPQIPAHRRRPLLYGVHAILAQRENDGPARALERFCHLGISGVHEPHLRGLIVRRLLLHHFRDEAAQVILEIVDTPGGIELRVLVVVA